MANSKRVLSGLAVLFVLLVSSGFSLAGTPKTVTAVEYPLADADWTIMVYLDADNSLEVNGYQDLAEMEKVASVGGVNVIVLFDVLSTMECHYFYLEPGVTHVAADHTVLECDCEKIIGDCPGELNMADPGTLRDFVSAAAGYAQADHYFLDLWNHGGGWWAICVDETAEPLLSGSADRLQMAEVATAVSDSGVYLDVIDYDACFMGMVEVAYENIGIADYMVASITTEPGTGYNYTLMLEKIQDLGAEKDPYDVSVATVDAYVEHYDVFSASGVGGYPYVSSSVFDLEAVEALVGVGRTDAGMDALGKILYDYADDYYLRGAIQSSESQTPQLQFMGEQFPFVDIGSFTSLLSEKMPEDAAGIASATNKLAEAAVPYCNAVTSCMDAPLKAYGISVYYTICWGHLYTNYLNVDLAFVNDTFWDEFLFAFSQVYVEA